MNMLPSASALIVIDVQCAFNDPTWGERNNPLAERNIAALLAGWRSTKRPILHVRHRNSKPGGRFHPDAPGFAVKPEARELPGEVVLTKQVCMLG